MRWFLNVVYMPVCCLFSGASVNGAVSFSEEILHRENLFEAVFWELKPFVYRDPNGSYTGMIQTIFTRGHGYCHSEYGAVGFAEKRRLPTRTDFSEFLTNFTEGHAAFGEGILEGIDQRQLMIGPIVKPTDAIAFKRLGFQAFEIALSKQLAVIVPRHKISLISKIFYGIGKSRPILLIAVMGSVICCVAIWLVERKLNDDFAESFTTGCGSAFWWSMASMTTVGYGDLVPKSPIGRLFALCWIFFGVLLGCLMTATMTDSVNSTDMISVMDQRVAVLEDSFESLIVEQQYKGVVVPAKSYEEVLEMVRREEVPVGIMVDTVAAWMQLDMHHVNKVHPTPLVIAKTKPGAVHFMIMMNTNQSKATIDFTRCMMKHSDEVYSYSHDMYNKYLFVQEIFISENLVHMFQHDLRFRCVVVIFFVLMVFGVGYDVVRWLRHEDDVRMNTSAHEDGNGVCSVCDESVGVVSGGRPSRRSDVMFTVKKYVRWFFGREPLDDY